MEQQKYKIYVNGTPVFLVTPEQVSKIAAQPDKNNFVARYTGKKKMIKQYLDLLDKNKAVQSVVLFFDDLDLLWADFMSCFLLVDAAGGYVQNESDQLLVFFRRGFWDMPKGKIDPGETPELAAVREVQEETGLVHVTLGDLLHITWHTYEQKGERILKKTWWYRMTTSDHQLIPQTEEGIVEICWVEPTSWIQTEKVLHASIRDVIEAGLKK
jgi:8-oxo-dGTP pyrophosphatase MutT (NUDIX family)